MNNTSEEHKNHRLFLVDASSFLYRAHFAIRRMLSTSKGFPTKAVFTLTSMLLKLIREKDPTYIAMVWDARGPTFRHGLYSEYKANRPAMPDELSIQIPYVRKIVDALGLPQVEVEGYEADDIIATLARHFADKTVLIVSGDKDLMQLVNSRVTMWDPMKDKITDREVIMKEFGLEPSQILDVMALSGDSSDNIPGVPGIGPKTAVKLIREFGSLSRLIDHLDRLPKGKMKDRLIAEKENLYLWRSLVQLHFDTPVPRRIEAYRRRAPEEDRLRSLFQELELTRFLQELVPEQTISFDEYETVRSEKDLKRWSEAAKEASLLVLDTETSSQNPMEAELVGISLCIDPPAAAYVPIAHVTGERQLSLGQVRNILGRVVSDPAVKKVGHNIKYDYLVLKNHGMDLCGIGGDTMVASYLVNPSRHRHNLFEISQELLGHKMISYKEVTSRLKKGQHFAHVDISSACDYSCEDVHVTALARKLLWKKLDERGLRRLFDEVEVPLIPVLAEMERAGVLVDVDKLEALSDEFAKRLVELEIKIYALAGESFNINSPKQLAEILFVRLKLPQVKKTRKKTGYSTDMEVLTELAKIHDLPRELIEYRNLSKLKSTYIDGLRKMLNAKTGRVHTSFNQTVTATGRLSSSDPNLQNIPVRTDEGKRIRSLFIAPPAHVLVSADYSQIDLRVLAHYSGDKALLSAFRKGEDVHRRTAAEVFGIMPEFVDADMRRVAKTVNFGIVYGMSAFGLSKQLDMDQRKAQDFIDRYFATYPGVKNYMTETVKKAREQGYVTTLLGRRRYIPDLGSKARTVREFAERTAINTPIQGTASDIIKLAMLRVDANINDMGLRARMLIQVHDELVLEVAESEVETVKAMLKNTMETVLELDVPLVVSIGTGKNWAEIEGK